MLGMLYIKKVVDQDINKELAFQFGPSHDFLRMNCDDSQDAVKYDFTLEFDPQAGDPLFNLKGKRIDTQIHYNSGKRECRFTKEFKNFLFNDCSLEKDDFIVLKREETTWKEKDLPVVYAKFEVIKKDFRDYERYLQLCVKNPPKQQGYMTVNVESEHEEDIFLADATDIKTEKEDYNLIFFGAPGTGKSSAANKLQKINQFETFRTTFHPESDYYSFVGSYKPTSDSNQKISYSFVPQVFLKAYLYAWTHPQKNVCLIIEEINRGNCAQIFGDIFQLLDRNYSDGFSKYAIDIDDDCASYIKSYFAKLDEKNGNDSLSSLYRQRICSLANIIEDDFCFEKMILPGNLYLYATMNTSDQSLFPMDSAFKRRWKWKYIPIEYAMVDAVTIKLSCGNYSWAEFLRRVNSRIVEITQSEDKQLGQFFIPIAKDNIIKESEFRDKVLFYLWNDIYKDEYGTASTIFKVTDTSDNDEQISFADLFEDGASRLLEGIMKTIGVNKEE